MFVVRLLSTRTAYLPFFRRTSSSRRIDRTHSTRPRWTRWTSSSSEPAVTPIALAPSQGQRDRATREPCVQAPVCRVLSQRGGEPAANPVAGRLIQARRAWRCLSEPEGFPEDSKVMQSKSTLGQRRLIVIFVSPNLLWPVRSKA